MPTDLTCWKSHLMSLSMLPLLTSLSVFMLTTSIAVSTSRAALAAKRALVQHVVSTSLEAGADALARLAKAKARRTAVGCTSTITTVCHGMLAHSHLTCHHLTKSPLQIRVSDFKPVCLNRTPVLKKKLERKIPSNSMSPAGAWALPVI